LPCTAVRSCPVCPPRGPTMPYSPDRGAGCPGFKLLAITITPRFLRNRLTLLLGGLNVAHSSRNSRLSLGKVFGG